MTAAWKKLRFILSVRSDFYMTDSLLLAVHAFASGVSINLLILDLNTWNHNTVRKLFVLDKNTWYNITVFGKTLKKQLHKKI